MEFRDLERGDRPRRVEQLETVKNEKADRCGHG